MVSTPALTSPDKAKNSVSSAVSVSYTTTTSGVSKTNGKQFNTVPRYFLQAIKVHLFTMEDNGNSLKMFKNLFPLCTLPSPSCMTNHIQAIKTGE